LGHQVKVGGIYSPDYPTPDREVGEGVALAAPAAS
jgi:hypothetical protein